MPQSLKLVGRGGGITPGLYLMKVSGVRTTNSLNITTADVEVITQLDLGASRKRGGSRRSRLSDTQRKILEIVCVPECVFTSVNLARDHLKGMKFQAVLARISELKHKGFIEIVDDNVTLKPRSYKATPAGWHAICREMPEEEAAHASP